VAIRQDDPTFGRYEILDELGRGSMAIVHKARDPVEDRDVAIKRILWPHGVDAERWGDFHERFHRKAAEAERLSHPGIVSVYEVEDNSEDGTPFIAMEYVPGPTLHELIRTEGALNPGWALSVADTLADALQSAHDAGVVHPDFKPANILVRESDGVAKIADFGVLHLSEPTGAGLTHGTPAYLSPECIRGEIADIRSELFSLSVILYEMLCGEPPFGGAIAELVRESILHLPPTPITEQTSDLAPAFDEFFDRTLAKMPEDRYQDGAGFREALASLREAQEEFERNPVDTTGEATAGSEEFDSVAVADLGAGAADESDTHFGYELAPAPSVEEAIAPRPAPRQRTTQWPSEDTPRSSGARVILWSTAALALLILFVVAMGWVWRFGTASDSGPAEPVIDTPAIGFGTITAAEPVSAPLAPVEEPEPPEPEPAVVRSPARTEPPKVAKKAAPPPVVKPEPEPVAAPVVEAPPVEPVPVVDTVEVVAVGVFVKNSFKESVLTLFVDGEEAFAADMTTDAKGISRVYKKALRKAHEDVSTEIEIPVGPHRITAHVLNVAKEREYEQSVEVELTAGDERSLRIVAGKAFGKAVKLTFE